MRPATASTTSLPTVQPAFQVFSNELRQPVAKSSVYTEPPVSTEAKSVKKHGLLKKVGIGIGVLWSLKSLGFKKTLLILASLWGLNKLDQKFQLSGLLTNTLKAHVPGLNALA